MGDLMQRVWDRALDGRVPLSVQFDLTYRCNERCVHCYLDHDDHGEMTTAEVTDVLDQLAAAGTLFLILQRRRAAPAQGSLRAAGLRRGARLRRQAQDERHSAGRSVRPTRIRELGVRQVQISIYSHRAEVHDAITKVPGSLARSIDGDPIPEGARTSRADRERADAPERRRLSRACGRWRPSSASSARSTRPSRRRWTATRRSLGLRISAPQLLRVFTDESLVRDEFCAPPSPATDEEMLDARPCSAGHTACYISPYGDVYPCVQFPLPTGNLRQQRFERDLARIRRS